MIELLGVGVRRNWTTWILRNVCARLEAGDLTLVASPEPQGMEAEPGWYAQRIAQATGAHVIACGKPFPPIYERLRARYADVAPERVLCVGDTLHTDILGGRAAGCRALLIEDGFIRGADALALAQESGIWPDFIAPRL